MKHTKYELNLEEKYLNRTAKEMWERKGRVAKLVESKRGGYEEGVRQGLLSS
jgi:hypothetical protein